MTTPNRVDQGPLIRTGTHDDGRPRGLGWIRHIFRPNPVTGAPEPYMDRYTLRKHGPIGSNPWRLYLHRWLAKDTEDFHNHPSKWSFSLVLLGSYTEEYLVDGGDMSVWEIRRRRVRWWNRIPSDRYHRIVALHPPSWAPWLGIWTLFTCGPLSGRKWGYWRAGVGHVDHVERRQP